MFLGGIASETTDDGLRAYCGQWGEVKDVHLMVGKGYGFVTFESPAYAQAFLEAREHNLDGRSVDAKAAVPKDTGPAGPQAAVMWRPRPRAWWRR